MHTRDNRIHVLLNRVARANQVISRYTLELQRLLMQERGGQWTHFAGSTEIAKLHHAPIVDVAAMTVTWAGRTCALGNTVPFQLIDRLVRRPNQFISFDRLIREVWAGNIRSDDTIRSTIRNLKSRLTASGMADLADCLRVERRHYGLFLPHDHV